MYTFIFIELFFFSSLFWAYSFEVPSSTFFRKLKGNKKSSAHSAFMLLSRSCLCTYLFLLIPNSLNSLKLQLLSLSTCQLTFELIIHNSQILHFLCWQWATSSGFNLHVNKQFGCFHLLFCTWHFNWFQWSHSSIHFCCIDLFLIKWRHWTVNLWCRLWTACSALLLHTRCCHLYTSSANTSTLQYQQHIQSHLIILYLFLLLSHNPAHLGFTLAW